MIKKPEFCNRKTKNVALSKAKAHFTFLHKLYNITNNLKYNLKWKILS